MSVRIRTTGWGLRRAAAAFVFRLSDHGFEGAGIARFSELFRFEPVLSIDAAVTEAGEDSRVHGARPKKAAPPSQTCFAGWTAADWRESVLG